MHILGVGGHMRRISNPMQYEFLQGFEGYEHLHHNECVHTRIRTVDTRPLTSSGACIVAKSQNRTLGTSIHWNGKHRHTVPHGNFGQIPTVYRGPYEYSVPDEEEDWIPQAQPEHAPATSGD